MSSEGRISETGRPQNPSTIETKENTVVEERVGCRMGGCEFREGAEA